MKSVFECFQRAARYAQQAAATVDPASRTYLLNTAEHWRARGRAAQAKVDGGAEQAPGRPVSSVPDSPRKPQREPRRRTVRRVSTVRQTMDTTIAQLEKANKVMEKGAKLIV